MANDADPENLNNLRPSECNSVYFFMTIKHTIASFGKKGGFTQAVLFKTF